jgi:hypothetical protein
VLVSAPDGEVVIDEDFGMSQFWYTEESADAMAREMTAAVLARSSSTTSLLRIACISAPSAFQAFKRLNHPRIAPFVLEYDRRFASYGREFVYYDFHHPDVLESSYTEQEVPALRKSFHGIIADPPYLNVECMSKTGESIRLLAKEGGKTPLLFNTGAILRKPIALLLNCRPCVTRPRHRVHLMNEFISYTNYEATSLGGWEAEEEE